MYIGIVLVTAVIAIILIAIFGRTECPQPKNQENQEVESTKDEHEEPIKLTVENENGLQILDEPVIPYHFVDEFPPAEFYAELYEEEEERMKADSVKEREVVHVSDIQDEDEYFVFYRDDINGKPHKGYANIRKQTEEDVKNNIARATILISPFDNKVAKDAIINNVKTKKFYRATKMEIGEMIEKANA